MAASPRCALLLAVLIVPALTASNEKGESTPKWKFECGEIGGFISIEDFVVQQSAEIEVWCDINVLVLSWKQDQHLQIFLDKDEESKTFSLSELHYQNGSKVWTTDSIHGFGGFLNGEVVCSHKPFDLLPETGSTETRNVAYKNEAQDDAGEATADTGEAVTDTSETVTTEAVTDASETITTEAVTDASETVTTEAVSDSSSTSSTSSSISSSEETDEEERHIRVVFKEFSLWYKPTISESQLSPQYQSSCRVEPDLTITLAVSGSVTGAVLVAAAAFALRVFC